MLELSKGTQIELEVLTSLVAGVVAVREQLGAQGLHATTSDASQAGLERSIEEVLKSATTAATSPPTSLWAVRARFHRCVSALPSAAVLALSLVHSLAFVRQGVHAWHLSVFAAVATARLLQSDISVQQLILHMPWPRISCCEQPCSID